MSPNSPEPFDKWTRSQGERSKRLETDINLAARSSAPVLITATQVDALDITRRIAAFGEGSPSYGVLVCDPASGDDVVSAMAKARRRFVSDGKPQILLVRDVQVLNANEQAALYARLTEGLGGPHDPSARIIASSSVDLYERVAAGGFDSPLFYRLNAIHIIAPGWLDAMVTA